jgi:putative FmdB family regulatory protein
MPTYEFVCPNGHHFDKFYRKMSDSVSELPCPVCGEPATRQISGGAGLLFKGSGFYITDYGKDGKKGMPSSSPTSTSDGGGSKVSDQGASAHGDTGSSSTPASEPKPAPSPKSTKNE